ncbi:DotU/TssL family secretion system protein [Variovorax sp. J22R133]|uniref:DotU/TssL family secretion system protein n=1 Tax=Variovorax brevis TaxID=3053503 RepID=UPI00257592A1|nr:DotU/TssL family secretion system protein [Variovorax sp. J22R133]MDM0115682.1 DotU/TssL family secretion system protein [Variovorax sp. J22R133]
MKQPGDAPASPAVGEPENVGEPDCVDEPAAARALRVQALPLVALMARLRDATPADPAGLRGMLAAAVNRFEADARSAGVDEASIAGASYVLCAWGDEQFSAAPWGAGGAGLLQRFHGEAHSGDKLLRLLTRLAEKPREHRALLELFHTCLSLGLRARPGMDNRDHDKLRSRVHLALQQVAPVPALVGPWHCAEAAAKPPRVPRGALPAVLLLGVLALGVYSASQLQLAKRVDGVLASLQRLVPARAPSGPPVAAAATVPPRLAADLRADIDAGRLSVRDEALRSVVVLRADALREANAPLARVGAVLAKRPGKVLVVGYTDGSDRPTAGTPSAWHQAMEWARGAAATMRPQVGDARLAVEARVESSSGEPPRRVEIVLFPE